MIFNFQKKKDLYFWARCGSLFVVLSFASFQAFGSPKSCDFIFPNLKNGFLVRYIQGVGSGPVVVESYISAGLRNFALTSRAEVDDRGYRHGVTSYFDREGDIIATVRFVQGVPVEGQWHGAALYQMGIRDASTRILLLPEESKVTWGVRTGKPLRLVFFGHGRDRVADIMPQSSFVSKGDRRTAKEKEYGADAFAELSFLPEAKAFLR